MSAARALALLLAAGVLTTGCAAAHRHDRAATDRNAMWQKSLARTPLAVTAAFDARGRPWLASVDHGHVLVHYSDDLGITTPRRCG